MYKLASGVERRRCVSMVESSAGDRAYYFLLATVYYNVLSGSVFGILEKVLANPKAFFQYAAHVLPRVSNYFIMLLFGMFAEVKTEPRGDPTAERWKCKKVAKVP